MARTFTVAQLRLKIQQRSDIESSRHVPPAEILDYINSSYTELYEILAQSGKHFFETTQPLTSSGAATLPLPADHFMTLRVDWLPDTNSPPVPVPVIQVAEIHRFAKTGSRAIGHRQVGQTLTFYPAPPAGQSYQHIYIPTCPVLALDTDVVDGVNGWEEFIVVDCAIKIGIKEETDVSVLRGERAELRSRIATAADDRELLETSTVVDVGDTDYERDPAGWRVGVWW